MTVVEWFVFFAIVFYVICYFVILLENSRLNGEIKTLKRHNKYLVEEVKIEHNRAEYFRKNCENNYFFDFEKVNSKKEK